jgi:hypothetical protein
MWSCVYYVAAWCVSVCLSMLPSIHIQTVRGAAQSHAKYRGYSVKTATKTRSMHLHRVVSENRSNLILC